MACACINQTFDFDLNAVDCRDVIYTDRSVFQNGVDFTDTPSYDLTLTDPGGYSTHYTVTKGIPLHLNLGDCLKPGIWTFETLNCTKTFTKKVPILCTLWCGYLKAVHKLSHRKIDLAAVRDIRENIEFLYLLGDKDIVTSDELTRQIERSLRLINCSCSCH